MKLSSACLTLALFTSSWCSGSALPPKEHKDRVHDLPLSEKEHIIDGDHNNDYDHDAFLGEDADEFENLSPEESKDRLGEIVDKIDTDHDGFVTEEELQNWVKHIQRKYIIDDTERSWADYEKDGDDKVTFQSYKERVFGYTEPEDSDDFKDMVERDLRKWNAADEDKDGSLTKEEFTSFLHPEETDHMKDIVVLETVEDIDKDKDGHISLEEYIADIVGDDDDDEDDDDDDDDEKDEDQEWVQSEKELFRTLHDRNGDGKLDAEEVKLWIMPEEHDHSRGEAIHLITESDDNKGETGSEPDWVKTEREQFSQFRDKNGDGKMDHEEVKDWIIPPNYDHSSAEAKHLIYECDEDKDGKLTKEEIVDHHDIFVGSQATEFGDALLRHDEF